MTSFVHVHYPAEHPGVARFAAVVSAAGEMRRGFDSTRGLGTLMLAAVVAALVVLADRAVDSWTDGGLMAAWVALWVVAFGAIALFAGTTKRMAAAVVEGLDAWSHSVAQRRADERLWASAQSDPRVMADLTAAIARSDVQVPGKTLAKTAVPATATPWRSLRQAVESWRVSARAAQADAQLWDLARSDPRVLADVMAAESRADVHVAAAASVPAVTQVLIRAEKAAVLLRDAAFARRRRLAFHT